jgi:hypothetical protein
MAQVTKEQEEEFKRRRAAGSVVTDEEREQFNKAGAKLTKAQYKAFLKATDSKCDGDS